jgi:hypothetical protein
VANTNNGRSPQLAGYYSFWEQAVFNALTLMLLQALGRLHRLFGPAAKQPLFRVRRRCGGPATAEPLALSARALQLCARAAPPSHPSCLPAAPPLPNPQLKTSLQNGDVVVQPPVRETTKLLTSYIKNVAESSRWAGARKWGPCSLPRTPACCSSRCTQGPRRPPCCAARPPPAQGVCALDGQHLRRNARPAAAGRHRGRPARLHLWPRDATHPAGGARGGGLASWRRGCRRGWVECPVSGSWPGLA